VPATELRGPGADRGDDPDRETPSLSDVVPTKLSRPYDATEVVSTVVDADGFTEVRAG
jgi:acetyl-CoA carboxylase carboxyltransferase component